MTVAWEEVASEFEGDGSLRDVYVPSTEMRDWEATFALLRAEYGPLRFAIDGVAAAVPDSAAEALAIRARANARLVFTVGGIEMACHFFTPDEIEFDLQPSAVNGPERLGHLVEFLRRIAAVCRRPAVLTAEGQPDIAILRADPVTGGVVYEPPGGAAAL